MLMNFLWLGLDRESAGDKIRFKDAGTDCSEETNLFFTVVVLPLSELG
jgi:hypothetical protein